MTDRRIIGFAGQKRSGKDTAAEATGFTRIALADGVRECALAVNPILERNSSTATRLLARVGLSWGSRRLSDLMDMGYTFETLKDSPWSDAVRTLLQRVGTEMGRNVLGDDVWVNLAERKIIAADADVVVTDVRFANEADMVHRLGGRVLHIVRPATDDPNPQHDSEKIDFPCDERLVNDSSVESFVTRVREEVAR